MPLHCYACDVCGTRTEELTPLNDIPSSVPCSHCGHRARRDFRSEHGGFHRASCGEIVSQGAGTQLHQIDEAERKLASRGIEGVRYDRQTGACIFPDRQTRLKCLKVMGLHDRNEIRG